MAVVEYISVLIFQSHHPVHCRGPVKARGNVVHLREPPGCRSLSDRDYHRGDEERSSKYQRHAQETGLGEIRGKHRGKAEKKDDNYATNFEKVGRAYCFRLVCLSVCACVRLLTFEW